MSESKGLMVSRRASSFGGSFRRILGGQNVALDNLPCHLPVSPAWILPISVNRERPCGGKMVRSLERRKVFLLCLPGLPLFSPFAAFWNRFRINARGKDFFSDSFYFPGDPECTMIARRYSFLSDVEKTNPKKRAGRSWIPLSYC